MIVTDSSYMFLRYSPLLVNHLHADSKVATSYAPSREEKKSASIESLKFDMTLRLSIESKEADIAEVIKKKSTTSLIRSGVSLSLSSFNTAFTTALLAC